MSQARQCSARRKDGQPCRARPIRSSDPPLCPAHAGLTGADHPGAGGRRHGFYSRTYTPEEIAAIVNLTVERGLEDEMVAVRAAVRRVMVRLQQELSPEEFARLVSLVFQGTNTIARLLRTQQYVDDKREDGRLALGAAVGAALDALAVELGLDL